MDEYVTLQPIYHSSEQQYYGAGEAVNLDHLTQAQIKVLVHKGVVAPTGDLTQIPGVGAERAQALIQAGINSLHALVEADALALEEQTGLTIKQIRGWQEKAQQLLVTE
jgi:predicted flap endonuclease-1-like 5' DNA nuclease